MIPEIAALFGAKTVRPDEAANGARRLVWLSNPAREGKRVVASDESEGGRVRTSSMIYTIRFDATAGPMVVTLLAAWMISNELLFEEPEAELLFDEEEFDVIRERTRGAEWFPGSE